MARTLAEPVPITVYEHDQCYLCGSLETSDAAGRMCWFIVSSKPSRLVLCAACAIGRGQEAVEFYYRDFSGISHLVSLPGPVPGIPAPRRRYETRTSSMRRAKTRGRHSFKQWLEVLATYRFRCARCGVSNKESPLSRDHIRPVSRGGSDSIENIQPLCIPCNASKRVTTAYYPPPQETE